MKNIKPWNCAATVVLSTALLVSSCSSIARQIPADTIVFDESLPPGQTALVIFGDTIHVLEYNSIDVEEAWYPGGKDRINKVVLPAGETLIRFNARVTVRKINYSNTFNEDGIQMRFNFEAGKEYTIAFYSKSEGYNTNTEYGIAIWDYSVPTANSRDADEGKMIKNWKLGELNHYGFKL
ncbi:MAG: hypothetical protein LBI67_11900 [Treponema sp.]|jgi:hypothetical protein|nr:hypothetical protein [Treponema sp.]